MDDFLYRLRPVFAPDRCSDLHRLRHGRSHRRELRSAAARLHQPREVELHTKTVRGPGPQLLRIAERRAGPQRRSALAGCDPGCCCIRAGTVPAQEPEAVILWRITTTALYGITASPASCRPVIVHRHDFNFTCAHFVIPLRNRRSPKDAPLFFRRTIQGGCRVAIATGQSLWRSNAEKEQVDWVMFYCEMV